MTTTVKAADFQVVAEARRAVQSQMSFFNRMMDAKKAGIASEKSPRVAQLMLEAGYAAPELAGRAKKLAELIVQDCISCCEQVISDPVPSEVDTWLNGGSQCIAEIKHRFES
jgi:hypothetical protein